MFAQKLVCLRETYVSLRQMRAGWPGRMPGHRRPRSMNIGVRLRLRSRSPLLFRLFNRGKVERGLNFAAHIFLPPFTGEVARPPVRAKRGRRTGYTRRWAPSASLALGTSPASVGGKHIIASLLLQMAIIPVEDSREHIEIVRQ